MAVAYTDLFDLAYGTKYPAAESYSPLWKKSAIAVSVAANYVIFTELASVANHANRLAWAYATLRDVQGVGQQLLWSLIQNPTIAASGDGAADSDVQTVIFGLVDTLAG
jgi:hypothetical protein